MTATTGLASTTYPFDRGVLLGAVARQGQHRRSLRSCRHVVIVHQLLRGNQPHTTQCDRFREAGHRVYYPPSAFEPFGTCGSGWSPYRRVGPPSNQLGRTIEADSRQVTARLGHGQLIPAQRFLLGGHAAGGCFVLGQAQRSLGVDRPAWKNGASTSGRELLAVSACLHQTGEEWQVSHCPRRSPSSLLQRRCHRPATPQSSIPQTPKSWP